MDKNISFSFENTQRIGKLGFKINRVVEEAMALGLENAVSKMNKMLYEQAEKANISIWDLCFMYAPSIVHRIERLEDNTARLVYDIRLVPIDFEFDKGPGYWKGKYYELKRQMQAIIDNKDI